MHAIKRFVDDCPVCENRGLICVGDDDQGSPCPVCNAWCPFCLEQPIEERIPHIVTGALFAAVRRTSTGLDVFEGYLCDWHKANFAPARPNASSCALAEVGHVALRVVTWGTSEHEGAA